MAACSFCLGGGRSTGSCICALSVSGCLPAASTAAPICSALGVSFVFISAFVYLPRVFPWTIEALAEPAWLSLCMPLFFSPATPQFRQIKRRRTRWVLKLLAVVLGFGWVLFGAYTTVSYDIRASVLWTVMVANYQLVVPALNAYFNKRRGNQHEENSENFGQNSGCAVDDDRQHRDLGLCGEVEPPECLK